MRSSRTTLRRSRLLCNCYLISGYVSFARPLIDQLVAVDPLTPLTRCMPGFADLMEGNVASALGPYRQMFEMDPGNPMARLFYVPILAANGRMSEVREIVSTLPPEVKDTIPARLDELSRGCTCRESVGCTCDADAADRNHRERHGRLSAIPRDRIRRPSHGRPRHPFALDCRGPWIHQLPIPGAPRSVYETAANGSAIPAASGDRARAMGEV